MQLTTKMLQRMAKGSPVASNVQSVLVSINDYGAQIGIDQPHRLAHFLAQEIHESGGFRYDKELASGAAYEGRADLGNTKRGDGVKFKGRGPEQLTGRSNYRRFTAWVRKFIPDCPDFEEEPEKVNTDPYEGLTAIWFWSVGNSTGKSLNIFADQNNIEMITRKVNGGLNGYDDRLDYFDRAAFILLGYPLGAYKQLQTDARKAGFYPDEGGKVKIDNDPGPKTRSAMFQMLVALGDSPVAIATQPSPVVVTNTVETPVEVEKKVEVPVETPVPVAVGGDSLQKPFYQDPQFQKDAALGGAAPTLTALGGADWKVVAIVAGVLILGIIGYGLIRRSKQASLQTKIAAVNTQAAAIRSAM